MIITRLTGGLGNQMFQYAAGLALAERRRTVLKLDVSWFGEDPRYESHNRYGLSCFHITEQFATRAEIERVRGRRLSHPERWTAGLARVLRLHGVADGLTLGSGWHQPPTFAHYPGFAGLPDQTYLDGMFQSEKFFAPADRLLRLHFSPRYPAPPAVAELAARIRGTPSIAVHFRRGDYARDAGFAREIGVVGPAYYERAVAELRERFPDAPIYVFSDDIDAVAREFRPPGPHEFVRCVEPWHPWDKIRLMSLCSHFVIANSTFSWWGAWLGAAPGKVVIAPDPWFADSPHDARDLVPEGWLRRPRDGRP